MSKCVGIFTPTLQRRRKTTTTSTTKKITHEKKWHTTFMRTLTHQQQSIKLNKFVAGRFFREFFPSPLPCSLSLPLPCRLVSFARPLSVFIFIIVSNVWLNYLDRALPFFRIRFRPCVYSIAFFGRIYIDNDAIWSDEMRCDANRTSIPKVDKRRWHQQPILSKTFTIFAISSHGTKAKRARECAKG